MTEELYFVNEKGQMEINFDSLELLTNYSFAQAVKKHLQTSNCKINVEHDPGNVLTVYCYENYGCMIFKFYIRHGIDIQTWLDFESIKTMKKEIEGLQR